MREPAQAKAAGRIKPSLIAGTAITIGCAALLVVLLLGGNWSALGLLGGLEIVVAMLLVSFAVNAGFSVVLLLLWPLVVRVGRRWFDGEWVAYYVSGLIALNVVWILWHRLSMVHQWASVRPFTTWSGIGQNVLLILVAGGIVLGAVIWRSGRAGRPVVGGAPGVGPVTYLAYT